MSLSCQNLLLAAGLTIAVAANGQSSLDDVAGKFVKYVRADRKEKLIVLTDKPFYSAGESIWLKAWCLDSLSNRFIFLSKNLYIDLVDDKDSVISQLLFNIPERKTAGKILLPATLGEGYYWLRAYTNRMLKNDGDRILVKPVYVINLNKPNPRALGAYVSKSAAVAVDTSAPRVTFYPEGGSIISGTTAMVAFRSISADGHPVDVTGYVTDPLHDTVAHFSSAQGLGKFSFDAYNPRKYTAHINWGGREVLYPLPAIDQFASQLTVVSRDDRMLKMQVSLGDSLYKKHKSTRILGMSRDSLCFAAIGTDMYQVNVPLANFPVGRASFFLFDDKDNLVSQRSIYIGNSDSGRIIAATDKANYSPGDKVNLSIDVKSTSNTPVMATLLSVTVTDERITGENGGNEDASSALPVAEDAQYRSYSQAALDLVMMTEPLLYTGWGKEPVGGIDQHAARFADSNLLDIRGKAVSKNNEPLQQYIVNLVAVDKGLFLADTTDAEGHFLFPLSEYDDGTRFNMKLTTIKGKGTEGKLILDKIDYPKFRTPRELKKGFSSEELAMVRRFKQMQATMEEAAPKDSTMLKPVIVEGQKKLPPEDEAMRASPFSDVIGPDQLRKGGVDMIYNALSNIPGFTSGINQTMSGSVGSGMASTGTSTFLVLVDGVQVTTGGDIKGFLETLDESNVEFIEVLKGPLTAIYGVQGAPGVILIHSVNHAQNVAQVSDKGTTTIYPKGYCNQPDVFTAGYDKKKGAAAAPQTGDVSTLYWNANIATDNLGNAKVDFLTGRRQATYCAAIVGVTPGGDIVEKTIQIKCR